jgi:dienelactone hydrolase
MFAMTVLFLAVADAGVVGKHVTYTADTLTMKGYLAYNDSITGKHPGILVVHEWWGNNDYSKMRAEMLAKLGYVSLAVDMYGNGKQADNPTVAQTLAGEAMKDPAVLSARFNAALNYLKHDSHVDTSQIGAIGYCFGGSVVLSMAMTGADLKSVVAFHPGMSGLPKPEKENVKARVLVCNGGADKFNSAEVKKKFKKEMKAAGANFEFIDYPGALHAFTNPAATELGKKFKIPIAYNASADKKSWLEMQKWLKSSFKP